MLYLSLYKFIGLKSVFLNLFTPVYTTTVDRGHRVECSGGVALGLSVAINRE